MNKDIKKAAMRYDVRNAFYNEVERLCKTGAVDEALTPINLILGVALENMADNFLRGEKSRTLSNLRKF